MLRCFGGTGSVTLDRPLGDEMPVLPYQPSRPYLVLITMGGATQVSGVSNHPQSVWEAWVGD